MITEEPWKIAETSNNEIFMAPQNFMWLQLHIIIMRFLVFSKIHVDRNGNQICAWPNNKIKTHITSAMYWSIHYLWHDVMAKDNITQYTN